MSRDISLDQFLHIRPAILDEEEMPRLEEIAEQVGVGATRPDHVRAQIQVCDFALHGHPCVNWSKATFFLTALLHEKKGKGVIVGSSKLQPLKDACWVKRKRPRFTSSYGEEKAYPTQYVHDELIYDSETSNALELAGIATAKQYQGMGIARTQTQARLLFLLLHPGAFTPYYTNLCANLLTVTGEDNLYPFYEIVVRPLVRPLVGECIEYDAADRKRYTELHGSKVPWFDEILGGSQPVTIPFPHILKMMPRDNCGNSLFGQVRDQTKAAERILRTYGFGSGSVQGREKHDLLDGGSYIELDLQTFLRRANMKWVKRLEPKKVWTLPAGATLCTFAPIRQEQSRFECVRALATIVDDEFLLIGEHVYHHINLFPGEQVMVLDYPSPSGKDPSTKETKGVPKCFQSELDREGELLVTEEKHSETEEPHAIGSRSG